MKYQVKQVADIAGVSIRTLHHYDDIQLLNPSALTDAGYRLYSDADLERLQQILFFRKLGFVWMTLKRCWIIRILTGKRHFSRKRIC